MASQNADHIDMIAWRVLADLLTPDGAFATLPPDGLEQLIEMRLKQESQHLGVALPALVRAFERAMIDLTGRRPPSELA